MQIDIYFRGGITNNYTGVFGISNILLPFIKELKTRGHTVRYVGDEFYENTKKNVFCNLLLKEQTILDASKDIEIVTSNKQTPDALFIEMRPKIVEKEFKKVCELIKNSTCKTFLYDTDLWANDLPTELRDRVTLLRPYLKENKLFKKQVEFHYFLTGAMKETYREIEFCYVGNQYSRKLKFDKFIGNISNKVDVVCGGNWLKKSKRDDSLQWEDILYIGEVPHNCCRPLLNKAKYTMQIVKPDYEEMGLITNRVFEATDAGAVCFADKDIYGIEKFVPRELIVDNADEMYNKMKQIEKMRVVTSSHEEMTGLQYYAVLQRAMLQEHTVQKRVKQLENIIKEVV